MSERIDIVINAEEILRALERIEAKIEEVEDKADDVIIGVVTVLEHGEDKIEEVEDKADTTVKEVTRELEVVDDKVDELEDKAEAVIEKIEVQTIDSYQQVLNIARASWNIIQGVVRAAGGTISSTLRFAIGTALGAFAVLKPVFTAQAVSGDYIKATLGMASIGLGHAAVAAAEKEQRPLERQFRGANMALNSIQTYIGSINF